MSEKKQVIYDLRYSYSGPFVVQDFYGHVDKWIKGQGYEKEPKKALEYVTKEGKQIQWIIEVHSHLDDLRHGIAVLHVLMNNVKEVVIKKKGKKIRINNGEVFVHIDGFIDAHLHGTFWVVKPIYAFIRTLIDRFIVHFYTDKFDGMVAEQCHKLYKDIRAFFNVQKFEYE